MGKKGEHQEQPRRRLPDATPCWCLDEPAVLTDGRYTHSPRCLALRALQGGYDFKDATTPTSRSGKMTQPQKKSAYLRHYSTCGRVMESAAVAGVDPSTVTRWRADDEIFAKMEGHAHDAFVENVLEKEAIRRAVVGVEKPVYQQGEMVGTVREYSDTLLIFMMKGERPGKYRDQAKVEVTGPGGGPLRVASTLASLDDHERAILRRVIDQALEQAQQGTEAKEEATETTPA